jgi:hypothetical protein
MSKRPLVGDADWELVYLDEIDDEESDDPALQVKVYRDRNDTIFYKVLTYVNYDHKVKYFYNESAHHAVIRYLVDKTGYMKYWSIDV